MEAWLEVGPPSREELDAFNWLRPEWLDAHWLLPLAVSAGGEAESSNASV